VGLLGFAPLALGLYELLQRVRGVHEDDDLAASPGAAGVLAVTLITVANGGDNVGLYVPLFAAQGVRAAALSAGIFLVLTLGLCAIARWLVAQPRLGAPLRKYGALLTPFVLIGLGLFILIDSGAFRLLLP
jgi:cadmium resistance protein CadD (predicted permease)